MSDKINSPDNEGAHTISPDGKILYFTACNRQAGKGSCDIYMSEWYRGGWDYPVNLYEINSKAWDSQPSISPDGRTLYFTSSRNGGKDLFVTHFGDNGEWSEPVPLPSNINTSGNEMSPFLHPDGKTLYFTSDGHLGMGGLDIFYSKMIDDSTWSDPVNIGYPINTYRDEAFLFVSASGEKAYFASGGLDTRNMDILSFELYKEARPDPVTYMKGIVTDISTGLPLQASFELTDLSSEKVIASSSSDEDGSFLLCIPTGRDYMLNVSADKYLFYSDNFNLTGVQTKTDPYIKNIQMQPATSNAVVVLKNIFFDTDKFDLKPESYAELEKVRLMLVSNPKMRIEIGGHTDNTGSIEHNKTLSENRAKAVVNYLVSKGISASRMTYKGYGDTVPISTNDTPEGRALNRRTEFKVISN
ncbi:Protein TolB [bioreactor metagenome]|uniref:Protein TolB n=1 Tax=bioreactor metagenome TaxID=1076179 RepID=A0A644YBD2_9ZZZZ